MHICALYRNKEIKGKREGWERERNREKQRESRRENKYILRQFK